MKQTIADKSLNINTHADIHIPLNKKNSCENLSFMDFSFSELETMASDLMDLALFAQSNACNQNHEMKEQVMEAMLSTIETLQTSLSFIRLSQTSTAPFSTIKQ
ncbi:hypothetical protein K2B98_001849 [Vibrio parahaemolyticus]|nr:hypothetical protein [Vibrio parahaemolyticus]EGQ9498386.1 hypothetical protein [Vibrio parahaemolyticus]EGQ9503346.1 hypothetical protein [Vibrio parahaemolyticus]EGQ9810664.1 hypothetical protein [Vibrio parahaemolyticus]EGR0043112.1 hypothetical protein [Vibrio parahaemolyticus]